MRDHNADYETAGARVIGISPDTVEDVAKFADRYGFEFTLLADAEHEVAEAYGTWIEKRHEGNSYWGVQRATFIIDSKGQIARVFPKVSPQSHDEALLEALGELAPA